MERITVWTKQHRAVLEQLEQVGRYTAKREYVLKENEDCSRFVLEAYNWLVKHSPLAAQKPADADYPVWLSFSREGTYLPQPNTVTAFAERGSNSISLSPGESGPSGTAAPGQRRKNTVTPNSTGMRSHRNLLNPPAKCRASLIQRTT